MWPHEIVLGPISFNGYGLLLILAVVFSLFFLGWTSPRAGINPKKSFDLAFWLVLFGLLGSRLAYFVFHFQYFKHQPLNIIKYWEGGLMFQGGLLFGLLLTIFLSVRGKFNFLIMSDALAPALALGQAIGRLGCLLAGCCHGRPAPEWLPMALVFPVNSVAPAGLPLYPTQIMESIGLFLITFLLMFILGRPRPAGLILAVYLTLAGLLRFTVDLFRGDYRGPQVLGLVPTSWAALLLFFSGLTMGLYLLSRAKKASQQKTPD